MCQTDIIVSSNIGNCIEEVFETTYNNVAKTHTLLEGAWIYCFSQGLKYFSFTEQQAQVYDGVGEQFYNDVIEAISNDDETGEKLYEIVEKFVCLFAYFINEEKVVCKGEQAC